MLPKIKKILKTHKKQVKIGLIVLAILIVLLVLYKSLFYSDSEKATYGVRLRDIKENEFTDEEKKSVQEQSSNIEGVDSVSINVKGRLIKFFVNFEDGLTNEDIKGKFNEMLGFVSDKVKSYYDITFYAIQNKDGEEKYPVIGYKHKSKEEITFDEF